MNKTKIEWATAVWNPVTGCTKVSEGCRNCYAEGIANRFWGERKFTDVRCLPYRLKQPAKLKGHQRVFVNSMSDIFHNRVEYDFIKDIWSVMLANPQHTFMIWTKRTDRMAETVDLLLRDGFGVLPNIWMGVSAENQQAYDERAPYLLQTPAAVRFLSLEPLLSAIDLALLGTIPHSKPYSIVVSKIDWVICGGESGQNARPMHPDWVRGLRDQCIAAGVPFFFKQWGEWAPDCLCDTPTPCREIDRPQPGLMGCMFRCGKKNAGRELDGRTWDEYPEMK